MNKNIITVGILLGASVIPHDILNSPSLDLYSDTLPQDFHVSKETSILTQKTSTSKNIDITSVTSMADNMSVRSILREEQDDKAILESLIAKIKHSKPLPAEFSKVIDEEFWDLI